MKLHGSRRFPRVADRISHRFIKKISIRPRRSGWSLTNRLTKRLHRFRLVVRLVVTQAPFPVGEFRFFFEAM